MDIHNPTFIGLLAGACTTISFLPQIIRVYRTRQTRDLSLWAYIILAAGLLLWILYGIMVRAIAIIIPNSLVFLMCIYIIAMKIRLE